MKSKQNFGINSIKLNNFRGFDKIEIQNFKKINIFVGKNGLGKTTILEAIYLALKPYANSLNTLYKTRGFTENTFLQEILDSNSNKKNRNKSQKLIQTPKWNDILSLIKVGSTKNTTIEASSNFNFDLEREVLLKPYPFSQSKLKQDDSSFDFLKNSKNDNETNFLYIATQDEANKIKASIISGIRKSEILPNSADNSETQFFDKEASNHKKTLISYPDFKIFYYTSIISNQYNHLRGPEGHFSLIKNTKYFQEILELLKKIDDRIENFSFDSEGEIRCKLANQETEIGFAALGDGVKKIFSILCSISFCKNGVLILDEIENGLHHSIQKIFWDFVILAINNFNVQLFVATHSYEMLEAFEESLEERKFDFISIYRISKDELGANILHFNNKELDNFLDEKLEIRG